jgi:spore cortex formation protein SpoVR/YcgB (stage V sporulation)
MTDVTQTIENTTTEPAVDSAVVHFDFALSEGVSDYFQPFVDGLNSFQEFGEFISDPTGEVTPQVAVRVAFPTIPGFWTTLFEDVVNGNDELYIDAFVTVQTGDTILYQTSLDNLAIILANSVSSGGSVLQFVLFENDDGEELEVEEDEDCES